MSVCLLLSTCDRYVACGFLSLSVSLYPCVYLIGEVIAKKLVGFQLTKKFLHCMAPELSLPYIILKNKIKTLRGGIQNFPDWCHHLYGSCGGAKHR